QLEGLGYVAPFRGSKHLRDTESKVKIEFLVTGGYPGDGKEKPVAFPDPQQVAIERDGIRYIGLESLIELKLASGMTGGADRQKDLADVVGLIKALDLPQDFGKRLNSYVKDVYENLWHGIRKRFIRIWRNKFLTAHVKNLEDMISTLKSAVAELEQMRGDG